MAWTEAQITDLVAHLRAHRGDTTGIEVKKAATALPSSLPTTLCAFANMPDGGTVILGIDERNDFAISGVAHPAKLEADLASVARNALTPSPFIETESLTVNGRDLVIATVRPLPLTERPCLYKKRAYLRMADGDYAMADYELRMIAAEQAAAPQLRAFDVTPVEGLTLDDLVPELVDTYLAATRSKDRRLAERTDGEILRQTGVMVASGAPTLAGLYALGDYPQGMFPSLGVTASVPMGLRAGGPRSRNEERFTGPIPVLLDDIMAWFRRNLDTDYRYRDDGHMIETTDLPLPAIRELVANALVHRDLSANTISLGKDIHIRLTRDRLVIDSPGGLHGVTIAQLESSQRAQAMVNQHLYLIAQKLSTSDGASIIEGEGGGIPEVFRAAREAGLDRPHLINSGVQFTAIMWRGDALATGAAPQPTTGHAAEAAPEKPAPTSGETAPAADGAEVGAAEADTAGRGTAEAGTAGPSSKNEPVIVEFLRAHGPSRFADLEEGLSLTSGQLRYALKQGIAAGRIRMVGRQGLKSTRYDLA